jgi:hypothetical protein
VLEAKEAEAAAIAAQQAEATERAELEAAAEPKGEEGVVGDQV